MFLKNYDDYDGEDVGDTCEAVDDNDGCGCVVW